MSIFRRKILASLRETVLNDIVMTMILSDGTNIKGNMYNGTLYATTLASGRAFGKIYLPKGSGVYCLCSDNPTDGYLGIQYSNDSSDLKYGGAYTNIHRGNLIDTAESGVWVIAQTNDGKIHDYYATLDFEKFYFNTSLFANSRINKDSEGNYKVGNHTGDTRAVLTAMFINYKSTALHIDENPLCPAWNNSGSNTVYHALTQNKDQIVIAFTEDEKTALKSENGFTLPNNSYSVITCNSTVDGEAESLGLWYYRKRQP